MKAPKHHAEDGKWSEYQQTRPPVTTGADMDIQTLLEWTESQEEYKINKLFYYFLL